MSIYYYPPPILYYIIKFTRKLTPLLHNFNWTYVPLFILVYYMVKYRILFTYKCAKPTKLHYQPGTHVYVDCATILPLKYYVYSAIQLQPSFYWYYATGIGCIFDIHH